MAALVTDGVDMSGRSNHSGGMIGDGPDSSGSAVHAVTSPAEISSCGKNCRWAGAAVSVPLGGTAVSELAMTAVWVPL